MKPIPEWFIIRPKTPKQVDPKRFEREFNPNRKPEDRPRQRHRTDNKPWREYR